MFDSMRTFDAFESDEPRLQPLQMYKPSCCARVIVNPAMRTLEATTIMLFGDLPGVALANSPSMIVVAAPAPTSCCPAFKPSMGITSPVLLGEYVPARTKITAFVPATFSAFVMLLKGLADVPVPLVFADAST